MGDLPPRAATGGKDTSVPRYRAGRIRRLQVGAYYELLTTHTARGHGYGKQVKGHLFKTIASGWLSKNSLLRTANSMRAPLLCFV